MSKNFYKQNPSFIVIGTKLKLDKWSFSCGAIDPNDPEYKRVDLPAGEIDFIADPNFPKFATLFVVPTKTLSAEFPVGSNYYLTEWSGNPALGEVSNPPSDYWADGIAVIPCLSITIPAGGTSLEVLPNIFELPSPDDTRRDISSGGFSIKAFMEGEQDPGYELLDAEEHASAFPVSLGGLGAGEKWYAKKEAV